MRAPVLTLRVSRRAVGAVVLSGEALTLADGRFLRSAREAAVKTSARYTRLLLDQARPATVVIDGPAKDGGTTSALLAALEALLAERRVALVRVRAPEVLRAAGLPPLDSRLELRRVFEPMFAELSGLRGKVKPFVVDAAAAALYAECGDALGLLAA